ncbi:hypothetical protein [Thermoplasma volcanium]|nr:hypothetical protein [Thermoplasma volcanium]
MEAYRKEKSDYDNFSSIIEARKKAADNFALEIKNTVTNFDSSPMGIDIADTKSKIIDFVNLAVSQLKEKIEERAKADQQLIKQKMEGDFNKAIGSLNLFMAQDPLTILDYTLYLSNEGGSYQARVLFKCDDGISYEFILNCGIIPELKESLEVSSIVKGVRLPVRKGRSLMSSEISVDYEKLDRYYLKYAEYSPKYLNVTFTDEDTMSEVSIFYPIDNPDMIKIDYKDDSGKISVDGDPVLSKNTDYKAIKDITKGIISVLQNVLSKKKSVSSILMDNQNIIEKGDITAFVKYIFQKYSYLIKDLISKGSMSIDQLKARLDPVNPSIMQDLVAIVGVSK